MLSQVEHGGFASCPSHLPLSKILLDPLKDYTNLKLFVFIASVYIAEIPILLPKIPLLPRFSDSQRTCMRFIGTKNSIYLYACMQTCIMELRNRI